MKQYKNLLIHFKNNKQYEKKHTIKLSYNDKIDNRQKW